MNPRDEDELRELLDDAVAGVEPRHGLGSIQSRTKVHPMSNRPWILVVGTAVVATAATIAAFAVVGDDTGTTRTEPGPAAATSKGVPDKDASSPSEGTSESSTPATAALPVYYVGETGQGPRLFREFHQGPADDKLTAALTDAVTGRPDDPDYSSPWTSGDAVGVSVTGSFDGIGDDGLITVDLAGDPQGSLRDRPSGMSEQTAQMAVQQLVYTAQAATQTTAPVQFLLFGDHTDRLLGVPVAEPLARADETSTLAQVWIIEPAEGAAVPSGFTVKGVGAFFEANVTWELRQGDKVVKSGFTTAEECCRMAPYSFTVDAPAGDYTLVVKDEDMSGGEGKPPFQDTKNVTIR